MLSDFIKSFHFPYFLKWSEIYNEQSDTFLIVEVQDSYEAFKLNYSGFTENE